MKFNDNVYKELRNQLYGIINIDVDDYTFKKFIDYIIEDSYYEFLYNYECLEYENLRFSDYLEIKNGDDDESVYLVWDPFINFHSMLIDYYNGSIKEYLIDEEISEL